MHKHEELNPGNIMVYVTSLSSICPINAKLKTTEVNSERKVFQCSCNINCSLRGYGGVEEASFLFALGNDIHSLKED